MKEKKVVVLLFLLVVATFFSLNAVFIYYLDLPFSPVAITGKGVTGLVNIFVINNATEITIHSPINTTYNFDIGDPYNITLNVTATFAVDSWWYDLYDLRHSVQVYDNVTFSPNSSFLAVRWHNRLVVYANDTLGNVYSKEVEFNVSVPNSAPILGNISEYIYMCEGSSLNYPFNATDADEDVLLGQISPVNPFFVSYLGVYNYNMSLFEIFTGRQLGKSYVGSYLETISVNDLFSGGCCVDTFVTNITVIEINNPLNLYGIGAQTVWTVGDNSTFYHQMWVDDIESGNSTSWNFTFNLTWGSNENLFDINSTTGVMNFTPIVGQEGTYSLEVCVSDNGISMNHTNISLCAPYSAENTSACDTFTLTVTSANRPPEIVNYTPTSPVINVVGEEIVNFWVSVRDPDGTIPDIDWYVDNILNEHNENMSNDSYLYNVPCGFGGIITIGIVTTDGLLNDTNSWNLDVTEVDCPLPPGGGGGGGGGREACWERWACDDWQVCQNALRSFESGLLNLDDYTSWFEVCRQNGLDETNCGFQIRSCGDLNGCNNSVSIAPTQKLSQACTYVENPGCTDGIKNCHSGRCEFLIDCGGPCGPCPTCSDGIKNQGEGGIDCGGPCPFVCPIESPISLVQISLISLGILFFILLAFIIYKILSIKRYGEGKGGGKKERFFR